MFKQRMALLRQVKKVLARARLNSVGAMRAPEAVATHTHMRRRR